MANHRLIAASNGYVSTYIYDGDGQRTVKQHSGSEAVYTNGTQAALQAEAPHYSLYANPYFVMNDGDKYTEHIYIGSERIAVRVAKLSDESSVLGNFDEEEMAGQDIVLGGIYYGAKREAQEQVIAACYDSLQYVYQPVDRRSLVNIGMVPSGADTSDVDDSGEERGTVNPDTEWKRVYYYSTDHLGSTRLVLDSNGQIAEKLMFLPTGEVFMDEQNSTLYHSDFLFSGKEMDAETGNYYFGARYLAPRLGIWLSPDPMQLKYPHVSSYAYCMGNPVRLIDPNGRDIVVPNVQDRERFAAWINAIASNTYGFDDFGVLYKMHEGKEYTSFPERQRLYSQIYSDYLDKGINNHDATIFMSIGNQIYDDGVMKDIDEHFGGGATALSKNMDVAYTILSGNNYFGSPSKYNEIPEPVWGDRNSFMNSIIHVSPTGKINVVDTPEWILVHELVGHGIPWMTIEQPNLSSAIINYNKVRREVGLSERFEDPNHYKYKIYNQE